MAPTTSPQPIAALGAVTLAVLAALAGCGAPSGTAPITDAPAPVTGRQAPDPAADVALNGCTVREDYGLTQTEAEVVVTNHSPREATYMVTIGVDGPAGDRLGTIHALADSLRPGQSTTLSGMDTMTILDSAPSEIACSVVNVDRSEW